MVRCSGGRPLRGGVGGAVCRARVVARRGSTVGSDGSARVQPEAHDAVRIRIGLLWRILCCDALLRDSNGGVKRHCAGAAPTHSVAPMAWLPTASTERSVFWSLRCALRPPLGLGYRCAAPNHGCAALSRNMTSTRVRLSAPTHRVRRHGTWAQLCCSWLDGEAHMAALQERAVQLHGCGRASHRIAAAALSVMALDSATVRSYLSWDGRSLVR